MRMGLFKPRRPLYGLVLFTLVAELAPCRASAESNVWRPAGLAINSFQEKAFAQRTQTFDEQLGKFARREALGIAGLYADADERRLPALHALGVQLKEKLAQPEEPKFATLVTRNPAFWRAQRELAMSEVTLPYLIAMIAILDHENIIAMRTLALTQAALPMNLPCRRLYARPLKYLRLREEMAPAKEDQAYGGALLSVERAKVWTLAMLSLRPEQTSLVHQLVDVEIQRLRFLPVKENEGAAGRSAAAQLGLTSDQLASIGRYDPVLRRDMDASIRTWAEKTLPSQRWFDWIYEDAAAEAGPIEQVVQAYEAADCPELAWLTWRTEVSLQSIPVWETRDRWRSWAKRILDESVVQELMAKPQGNAVWHLPDEGTVEAWPGNPDVNPIVAVQVVRKLADLDVMLEILSNDLAQEARVRLQRVMFLLDVDAVKAARVELEQIRKIPECNAAALRATEAKVLLAEGRYRESNLAFSEVFTTPEGNWARKAYAHSLFLQERFTEARVAYRDFVRWEPNDPHHAIMLELSARRSKKSDAAVVTAALERQQTGEWPAAGLKYLLGQITAEELVTAARRGSPLEANQHECEACFWLAEVAASEARRDDEISWLKRCLATGVIVQIEYHLAEAELKRVDPEAKKRKPEKRTEEYQILS